MWHRTKWSVDWSSELPAPLGDVWTHSREWPPLNDAAAAVELATRLQLEPLIELYGIYTHGGHGYGGSTREQIDAIAAQERSVMNEYAPFRTSRPVAWY